MDSASLKPTIPRFRVPDSAFGLLGLLGMLGITWGSGAEGLPGYVWLDVAAVYLLSSLPLAVALCRWVERHNAFAGSTGLGAACLSVVGWLAASQPLGHALPRAVAALGVGVGIVWFLSALLGRRRWAMPSRSSGELPGQMVFGVVLLCVAPGIYVQARCRHDLDQVAELVEQSRIGEAHALAVRVLALAPAAQLKGRPLQEASQELQHVVEQLKGRVAEPLADDASDALWLARVRELAVLGQTRAALDLMAASAGRAGLPQACNLRGTILETLHQWQSSHHAYETAKSRWQSMPPSEQRQAGLTQATTGIAYCERKLGRYRAAEAAYLERLALSPTAGSHFLLAQFYDDTQRSALARTHTHRAMMLSPEHYQQQGEQLLKKLASFHFGCWSSGHRLSD